jgi:hypothetical protein
MKKEKKGLLFFQKISFVSNKKKTHYNIKPLKMSLQKKKNHLPSEKKNKNSVFFAKKK